MATASTGEVTTLKGSSHAVMRAPPAEAPAVEPTTVANTQWNDATVATVEPVCCEFMPFLMVA
jgi:hypothetical protein